MAVRRFAERWRYWREVIRRQEASELSVAAFCREEQVAPASFFAWRKKLAEADQHDGLQAPAQSASGSSERDAEASHAARAQFVPIELSPGTPSPASFEIVHPDGYRVVVPARFEAESLREILLVLKEVASC